MEMKKIIEKVNYYSKLARERELTEEEKVEREKYRKLYLEQFKAQVKGHLDNIKVVQVDENNNPIDENVEEVSKDKLN